MYILFLIVNNGPICTKLTVTGDSWASCTGTYIITNEIVAAKAPDMPVYKLQGKNRYIYFTPTNGNGWRIAKKIRLSGETEGLYYYKSKFFSKS